MGMPVSSATATIQPARRVAGRLSVPGDKSISHRYALLAALADGPSHFAGFAPGADCHATLTCLQQLGVDIRHDGPSEVAIEGRGLGGLLASGDPVDAKNSGTTMRLLAGILAGHRFATTLTGDSSLSRRPMTRVVEPLERMGARIESTRGHAPLTVHGAPLRAIAHRPTVPSAQVKSAVLLAGLHAEGVTSVAEPAQTRDHTERALTAFGVSVSAEGWLVAVAGRQRLRGQRIQVPGDFSSAAFWMVAAAALPGSRVEIEGLGLNPTRTALVDVLRRFGAVVRVEEAAIEGGEPRGRVIVEADRTGDVTVGPDEVPGLIDELPALAALVVHGGALTVRGAGELRVKESDRITALVTGLRGLGLRAEELPDGFVVVGGQPAGGTADAAGDHRLAMAFAIVALAGRAPSTIQGAPVVGVSYPTFFESLQRLSA